MPAELMRPRNFDIQEATINAISDNAIFASRTNIVSAFYPGQPISFVWRFWDLWGNSGRLNLNGINITAKVLLSNRLTAIYQSGNFNYLAGGISEMVLELPVPIQWFYKIDNRRSIILQVNLKGDVFEGTTEFAIIGEQVYDWLEFLQTPSTEHLPGSRSGTAMVAWKEAYTISAIFTNKSQYTKANVVATLYENVVGSTSQKQVGVINFTVNPLGQFQLNFNNIKQEWQWLIPKLWIPKDSAFKMFEYHIVLTINDDFNNTYSNVKFGPFPVNVRVSDTKQAAGYGATAATAIAVILYALSWLITQAPGNAVHGVADGLGSAALDPPEPDPKFNEEVLIRHKRIYKVFKGKKYLDSIGKFFDLCSRIATASLTLSKIEGRILGAKEYKNQKGLKLQKNSYSKILQALMIDASNLEANANKAIGELNGLDKTSWKRTNKIINSWIRNGIDASFKRDATKAGISQDAIKQISIVIKDPLFIAQLKNGVDVNLKHITDVLLKYAADSLDYGGQILKVNSFRGRK